MKIETLTGKISYISAGHEAPYWLKKSGDEFNFEFLDMDRNKVLGEGFDPKSREQEFILSPDESLVLFTDGIFSVVHADGKILSEKRFGKRLAAKASSARSAQHMLGSTVALFNEHRQDLPLPDDVTIVAIHHRSSP